MPPCGRQAVTERNLRMSEFLYFILGTTLGGMVGVACMCVLQINRLSEGKGMQMRNEMCRYCSD